MVGTILATPPAVLEDASTEEQARLQQVLHHLLPIGRRQQGLLNDAAVVSSLQRYELEQIAVPTLVMSAADDRVRIFAEARYAAQCIPRARFVGYTRGGHLWVGHHKEVFWR